MSFILPFKIEKSQILDESKHWSWSMIESEITADDLTEEHIEQFRNLFEQYLQTNNWTFIDGPASCQLKKLIIDEWKATINEVWNIEVKVQEFKMSEAFLESLPQIILQTCAVIHEDP